MKDCKFEDSKFAEGHKAFRDWIDAKCQPPMPTNPYTTGSSDYEHWGQGFDDADWWQNTGQYLDQE